MRVDLREVESACDQEDHGADGRESAITAGLALGGLEEAIQAIQGLQEAVGGPRLHPGTAVKVGSYEAGHGLHGLDFGTADVGTPRLQHHPHDIHLFAIQYLAELLPVYPDLSGAFGRHVRHQGIEVISGGGGERAGILEERPTQTLQGGVGFLLGASGEPLGTFFLPRPYIWRWLLGISCRPPNSPRLCVFSGIKTWAVGMRHPRRSMLEASAPFRSHMQTPYAFH